MDGSGIGIVCNDSRLCFDVRQKTYAMVFGLPCVRGDGDDYSFRET